MKSDWENELLMWKNAVV